MQAQKCIVTKDAVSCLKNRPVIFIVAAWVEADITLWDLELAQLPFGSLILTPIGAVKTPRR